MPDNVNFDDQAMWVIVDENGNYYSANKTDISPAPIMFYKTKTSTCQRNFISDANKWGWNCSGDEVSYSNEPVPTTPTIDNELLIRYQLN